MAAAHGQGEGHPTPHPPYGHLLPAGGEKGRRLRITKVIGGLGGGGAERVCVNLANAWAGRGHEVTILTGARDSSYGLDSRVVVRDPGVDLRSSILGTAPDVVVSHLDITNVKVLAAMQGSSVPVIVCEHTDLRLVSIGALASARGELYRGAFHVVCTHAASAEWLLERGIRAVAIANPLTAPHPGPLPTGVGRGDKRVVALSRLSPEKRNDMLIGAFGLIADDFPSWSLEIYGDGPQRHSLSSMADGRRVRLCGFANDPYAVLAGADLFVSASWVEGFGNAIWEAMACGVPVVVMDCGAAVRTMVRQDVDGVIVWENSAHGLAKALASVMGDDAKRKSMGSKAREVVARFPIEESLQKWDALLESA